MTTTDAAIGQPGLADRNTPLIRDEWYVAAFADELTREPLQRLVLEQDIVLYRREDGGVVALQNRCAHRSYPLSEGCLNGDRIVCGYHGFEYAPDGSCAHVPSLRSAPRSIRIRAYPVVEQGPLVWIWMGDGEPDDGKLYQQPWLVEDGWKSVGGYFYMRASYLGLHENLLDLTHFPFLHGDAIGSAAHAEAQADVRVEGDMLYSTVMHTDAPVPGSIVAAAGLRRPIDRLVMSEVPGPAISVGRTRNTDSSDPPKVFHRHIIHCMTPETKTTTHYFWVMARDVGLDDEQIDDDLTAMGNKAFDEDRVALERIERLIERDHRPGFRDMMIATDSGGVQILRLLARRAERNVSGSGADNQVAVAASPVSDP